MARLIHEIDVIKCIDETGGGFQEKFGSDEIALAGVQIDARGHASVARRLNAGSFESQQEKAFNPSKVFASFDLPDDSSASPRLFQVVLMLAELDSTGGLDQHVKKVVSEVNAQPRPAALGGLVLAEPILASLGQAALRAATKFVVETLKDDLFPPVMARVEIPNGNLKFDNGKDVTSREVSFVKAANGKYMIKHNWRIDR